MLLIVLHSGTMVHIPALADGCSFNNFGHFGDFRTAAVLWYSAICGIFEKPAFLLFEPFRPFADGCLLNIFNIPEELNVLDQKWPI